MTKVPKELDIHKYIDYDTQYEKRFVEPLSFITDNINWNIDRSCTNNIRGLFHSKRNTSSIHVKNQKKYVGI